MTNNEKNNAQDQNDAQVIRRAIFHEAAEAKGKYTIQHYKPLEHLREEYCRLRDRVQLLTDTFAEAASKEIQELKEKMEGMVFLADTYEIDNVVTTVGKNLALDTYLAGSAYTVTGPFIGLISNVSYTTGPAAGDTMASHGGWTEAGGTNAPTYTAPRKTAAWSAASGGSKALSSNLSFAITSGTNVIIKGCFMVYGSGAVSTIDNTAGTLYSAGTFSGGDKTVSNGDTLTVSYSTSL